MNPTTGLLTAPIRCTLAVTPDRNQRVRVAFNTQHFAAVIADNQLVSSRLHLHWLVKIADTGIVVAELQQNDTSYSKADFFLSSRDIGDHGTIALEFIPNAPYRVLSDAALTAVAEVDGPPMAHRFRYVVAIGTPNDALFIGDNLSYREGEGPAGNWFHNRQFRWAKSPYTLKLPTFGAQQIHMRLGIFVAADFEVLVDGRHLGNFSKSHKHDLWHEDPYEISIGADIVSGKTWVTLTVRTRQALPGEQFDLRQLFSAASRITMDFFSDAELTPHLGNPFALAESWAVPIDIAAPAEIGAHEVIDIAVVMNAELRQLWQRQIDTGGFSAGALLGACRMLSDRGLLVALMDEAAPALARARCVIVPRQDWFNSARFDALIQRLDASGALVVIEAQQSSSMFAPPFRAFCGADWSTDGCSYFADALMSRIPTTDPLVGEIWTDFLLHCTPERAEAWLYGQRTNFPAAMVRAEHDRNVVTLNGSWFLQYWLYDLKIYSDALWLILSKLGWAPLIAISGSGDVALTSVTTDAPAGGTLRIEVRSREGGYFSTGSGVGRGYSGQRFEQSTPWTWPFTLTGAVLETLELHSAQADALPRRTEGAHLMHGHPGFAGEADQITATPSTG